VNKQVALKLKEKAEEIAEIYSNPDREFNYSKESFEVHKITSLSEFVGVVIYEKSSGKRALCLFFYVQQNGGKWYYIFPSDSHLLGLQRLSEEMRKVEEFNFKFNFEEKQLDEFI
jgi:hypothetical protein